MKRAIVVVLLLVPVLAVPPALAGRKKTDERIAALEQKVQHLEQQLAELRADLEKRLAAVEKRARQGKQAPGSAAKKAAGNHAREAADRLRQAREAINRNDLAAAKRILEELRRDYADTPSGRRALGYLAQVNVVGREAPDIRSKVLRWFRGEEAFHPEQAKATIVVFWEVWCPHCRREVPKLQELYEKYHDRGLEIIGLTRLTHGKTPEDVENFLAQKKVTYPVAQEKGDLAGFFAVRGIPAAAVIRDGKVTWRNHPARITEQMIEDWLR